MIVVDSSTIIMNIILSHKNWYATIAVGVWIMGLERFVSQTGRVFLGISFWA